MGVVVPIGCLIAVNAQESVITSRFHSGGSVKKSLAFTRV